MIHSDRELVKKIMGGDREAVTLFIRGTEKLVAQIVFRMVRNPADRKDLVQDIYLKAFKHLSGFRHQCKLSTWIAQIGYNTCLNHLEKRRPQLLDGYGGEEDPINIPWEKLAGHSEDVSQLLSAKERAEILEKICADLPPVYHTLITLYHKEELSILEICEITGLPAGTVKNYLFRARKILKEKLLRSYLKEDL